MSGFILINKALARDSSKMFDRNLLTDWPSVVRSLWSQASPQFDRFRTWIMWLNHHVTIISKNDYCYSS